MPLFPTVRLPKEILVGETLIVNVGTVVAVPDIASGERVLVASLVIARLPV